MDHPNPIPTAPPSLQQGAVTLPPLRDMWQIVVAGNMDPRQHTPAWYKLIGCIDEKETTFASGTFGIMGADLVFDVGPFGISTQSEKWTIYTVYPEQRTRLVDVAKRVFSKLSEIYVAAYGINRFLILNPGSPKPLRQLANRAASSILYTSPGETTCDINFKRSEDDGSATFIKIAPAIGDDNIMVVTYNRHHAIPPQPGYYDIGPMVQNDAEPDWRAAEEYGKELVRHIVNSSENHHG